MGLRSAVEGLTYVARPLPALGATARFAARQPPAAAPAVRPAVDLNAVAARFLDDVRQGAAPSGADWNKIAWCLWAASPAIAEHDLALGALLDRVVHTVRMERKRPYRQLASSYLMDFAADRPALERISGVLRSFAPAAGAPWDRLQAEYAIFDGAKAAVGIARLALNERTSVHGVFEAADVRGPLLAGGFARAAHDEGLKIIAATPVSTAAEHIATVRRWSLRPDKRLIFENSKIELARAVVLPFGDQIPGLADRKVVLDFVIGRFGDPRVTRGRWIGMDDVAEILRRWLIEQSLQQFLDVVDKLAPDHMWKYRRAFWLAYHKADLLQNAWVVFGDDGAVEAMRAFSRAVQFGKFKPGGSKKILPGHAVLLLDFGPCVVADWSHNGRCNIWKKADKTRPADLNAPAYTSDEIMRRVPKDDSEASLNKNDIFSHHGSENYFWQNRVADRLHQLIGVRVPQPDYQVR
jgi:EH_Signature domain